LPFGNDSLTPKDVIAADFYGFPVDYDSLQRICDENGLFLLEDAAQSFGAVYNGNQAGSFGDAAVTSFFPAEPFGCYGARGMVFTDRVDLAERMRSIRVHGKGADKYDNVRAGLNARLDTLQAAVLLAKWQAFQQELKSRENLADRYGELLERSIGDRFVLPRATEG
jgi:dTDP-4-amino-4,6-dideoxygalactose transaminase